METSGGLDGSAAFSIKQPGSAPVTLNGQACERGIFCQAGASLTFDLGGKYKMLVGRVGVADGVLPTTAVRVVVLGDGKELYRSEPRTSLDEAANISLNLSGVRALVLRVESPGDVSLPAAALWADPLLVK